MRNRELEPKTSARRIPCARAAGSSHARGRGARQRGLVVQQRRLSAAREAPIAFVPSAVTRLMGHYVVFACCNEAARAQ